MRERRYRLTDLALEDLKGIASYIGQHNPAAADAVIDQLIGAFSLLVDNPEIGTKRDDIRPGLRVFTPSRLAHNYVVLFYQTAEGVEVNAVLHASRDWPSLIARADR